MKSKRIFVAVLACVVLGLFPAASAVAQDDAKGNIDWIEGFIVAVGNGTSDKPSLAQRKLMANRAAKSDAQRNLLEVIKGVKVDSNTSVENFMVKEDIIKTNVSGVVKGAQVVKESYQEQPDGSILATVEMRICISRCKGSSHSLIQALSLDKKTDDPVIPPPLPQAVVAPEPPAVPKAYAYDKTKPVTGVVFNLDGRMFERVIMPVVVTEGEDKATFTVYSAKSVKPNVIRTYGVVRYAETVDQAMKNKHLGSNVMVISAEDINAAKMIVIKLDNAKYIQESIRHGNDYLGDAKVVIAATDNKF